MDQPNPLAFQSDTRIDEDVRLGILAELDILDTPPEDEFDTIVQLARTITGCSIALLSLVDSDRQWFKAKCGLSATGTPREDAFCAHTIHEREIMIVSDATKDRRFRDNPLVTASPHVVFYAGVPIRIRANCAPAIGAIGTLCVIDHKQRCLSAEQEEGLKSLARITETLIERRASTLKAMALASERKANLRAMSLSNRQMRQAERMANIGSWRLNLADNTTQWSEQVYAIHGLPVGQDPCLTKALDFYPPEARPIVAGALMNAARTGQPFDIETDFITAHGALRRVQSVGEVEVEDGHPVAVVGVFRDITEQFRLQERLRRSAQYDDLTGLPNRAYFNEFVDGRIDKALRNGEPLALMLIDLDGFKLVNDQCGHRAGDRVLQDFAATLSASCMRGCFIARLGGDEFVVVVHEAAICHAIKPFARRLLAELRRKVDHADGSIELSATIGASRWTSDVRDKSDLLHRADLALYEAKRLQRGSANLDGIPIPLSVVNA